MGNEGFEQKILSLPYCRLNLTREKMAELMFRRLEPNDYDEVRGCGQGCSESAALSGGEAAQ